MSEIMARVASEFELTTHYDFKAVPVGDICVFVDPVDGTKVCICVCVCECLCVPVSCLSVSVSVSGKLPVVPKMLETLSHASRVFVEFILHFCT